MSTARLNRVTKSRGVHRCRRCGEDIPAGAAYVWFAHYRAAKETYHDSELCKPTLFERESNPRVREHMSAERCVVDATNATDPGVAAAYLTTAVEHVQEVVDSLQAALDGWAGTGFELSGQADDYAAAAGDLEEWMTSIQLTVDCLELMAAEAPPPDPGRAPAALDLREDWEAADYAYRTYQEELTDLIAQIEEIPELSV